MKLIVRLKNQESVFIPPLEARGEDVSTEISKVTEEYIEYVYSPVGELSPASEMYLNAHPLVLSYTVKEEGKMDIRWKVKVSEAFPARAVERAEEILGHSLPDEMTSVVGEIDPNEHEFVLVESLRTLSYPSGWSHIEVGYGLYRNGTLYALDGYFRDVMPSVTAIFGGGGDTVFAKYVP